MKTQNYKNPVLFYLLATLFPWTFWYSAAYISHQTPLSSSMTIIMSILAFLGLVSPNFAAWKMISSSQEMKQDVKNRLFSLQRSHLNYWIFAGTFMLISILAAQLISLLFGYSSTQFKLAESFSFTSGVFPVWILLIAAPLLEELAWHSYGIDSLRKYFNLFNTSIIFALFWGIWHMPLSSINNYYHSNLVETGLIYSLNFFLSLFPFVIIMNWIYYKTDRNILITILFHISAGYFNEIFQTHPMSKVIQTGLLSLFTLFLLYHQREFFFTRDTELIDISDNINKQTERKAS